MRPTSDRQPDGLDLYYNLRILLTSLGLLSDPLGLLRLCIVLKQERQLLYRFVDRFWKQKVDEGDLECDEYAVTGEVLPARLLHTDWIHKGVEEEARSGKPLEQRGPSSTDAIREQLGEVGVSQGVESHIVAWLI